uniref:WIT1/2 N-terminal helical bundle domain-containing protein n=1 Tax=Kalanchoe fedtschenkoi TaxID=63787 RepID=A0A7N0VB04_KALFE
MAVSAEDDASASKAESEVYEDGGMSPDSKFAKGLSSAMEVLSEVDLDLAYSSEKLVNLHILLTHALAWEDFEEIDGGDWEGVSDESIEKVLVFDMLSGLLEGEVAELDSNMEALQARLLDAQRRICSFREKGEMFNVVEEKLRDSEESWKQFREKVTEMKVLSAKLQRSLLAFRNNNREADDGVDIVEAPIIDNSMIQMDQQRHILRMLEKSLARELDLEKKFLEAREREEELKVKLHYTEQFASHLEDASEAAWARFLEADNAAEVLLGTSKESLSRLQILQFSLNVSLQRENDLKSKLENCLDQVKVKEEMIQKLQAQLSSSEISLNLKTAESDNEILTLHGKVKLLEEKVKESEARNQAAAERGEMHEARVGQVEKMVDSLRETIAVAESRAESAEAKLTILTETNLELTEELGFLKTNDPNAEKVTLLEKQLRDLELQLQHAKAAAEASQEQQTQLYTAIWDMETLIEDLKSKVSKYESKIESTEEQCLLLSESNFELSKELSFVRDRLEFAEASLEEANSEKLAISVDINIRSKLIMDLVAQIATERERVQKQLAALSEENKALAEKLRSRSKSSVVTPHIVNGKIGDGGLASNANSHERDDRIVV